MRSANARFCSTTTSARAGRLGVADQRRHVQDVLPLHAFARLVEQQQRLRLGEAANEREDLLLAARERAGVLVEPAREDREARETAARTPPRLPARRASA